MLCRNTFEYTPVTGLYEPIFELADGTNMTFPDGTRTPPLKAPAPTPEKFVGVMAENRFVKGLKIPTVVAL
jgi:hypothetical protein